MEKQKQLIGWFLIPFIIGVCLSALTTWQLARSNDRTVKAALDQEATRLSTEIIERLNTYQYGLRGARGAILTQGEANTSRALFKLYSLTRDIKTEFPGAHGFGFIRRVPQEQEADFLAKARADGKPDFNIRQLAPHEGERYVIQYIEPVESNSAAVGLDTASEENRREAAESAMYSGQATLTGPITLVQTTDKPMQSFLIFLPIYRGVFVPTRQPEREAQLFGWSYAPLIIDEVLPNLSINTQTSQLQLRDITKATAPQVFFSSAKSPNPLVMTKTIEFEIFGRRWQQEIGIYPAFIQNLNLTNPKAIFSIGTLMSLLVAGFIGVLGVSRLRKQAIIVEQSRLAAIVEHSIDAIIGKTLDGTVTNWNHGAELLFGYSAKDAIGKRIADLVVPPDLKHEDADILARIAQGETIPHFITLRQKQDSTKIFVSVAVAPIRNALGQIVGASKTVRDISEQKAAEDKIRAMNFQLEDQVEQRTAQLEKALQENRLLLDTINKQLLYSATDIRGNIIEANENFIQKSGYQHDEIIGNNHRLFNAGVHDQEFWRGMWKTIASGKSWHGEICNRTKHGALLWFDAVITPVKNEDGKVERYIALRTDISERKQAELERAKLTLLISSVLNAATEIAVIATDVDGTITIFNRGAELMLGYQAEELVNKSSPAVFHLMEEVVTRGQELSQEYGEPVEGFRVFVHKPELEGSEAHHWTYVRKDGSHLQVMLVATAMRDDKGDITGYLGMATDVTQELQAKRHLQSTLNQLDIAADMAELGIWRWYLADNSLEWSDRMYEIYDQPISLRNHGLSYQHWHERVHPEDVDATAALLMAAVEGTAIYNPTFRICKPNGDIRYVQAGAQVERDGSGKAIQVTGINRDVTDQKELEATLIRAKEDADTASAAKSAFLANMSHEIRTPMNAVLGMLQLVQQTELSARQQDYLFKCQTAAKSLLGLLNDILDFSKIDSGKLQLDNHPFEVEPLLRDLAVILSANQGDKPVEIMFDIDPRIPAWLMGDRLRLQQILINLAGNALKFTHKGHVLVQMRMLEQTAENTRLQIGISDTGIGMSQDQLSRIFEGFVQAETSTTRRFGGTGLGLAISKRLVSLMGGELSVESELGAGSRFWFDISLALSAQQNPLVVVEQNLSQIHLLVVDDNAASREILLRTMNALGVTADEADGGLTAIEKIRDADSRNQPYDLVLMDWRMPDIDGLRAAEIIRSTVANAPAPIVIMVTAFGREEIIKHNSTTPPYADLLTKPITPEQLIESIRRALGGASQNLKPIATLQKHQQALSNLKLLVVEDNALNRQVAFELLTAEGALVEIAECGLDGVAKVVEGKTTFDLVIMDVQMPDIDGMEATRRIRKHKNLNQLPILAMTANASADDRAACLAAGMNDHVGKPIDIEELVTSILVLLGKRNSPIYTSEKSAANSSEALIEEFAAILKRFSGKVDLYKSLFARFHSDISKLLETIDLQNQQKNPTAIAAALHSIKGIAGTMGAKALAARASELEKEFKSPDTANKELTQETLNELKNLLDKSSALLEQLLREFEPVKSLEKSEAPKLLSPENWKKDLADILPLLESDNLNAGDMLEKLYSASHPHQQVLLAKLVSEVNELKYDLAITTINQILATI